MLAQLEVASQRAQLRNFHMQLQLRKNSWNLAHMVILHFLFLFQMIFPQGGAQVELAAASLLSEFVYQEPG